jgi:NAD(P)-dependent dehydrogenase (short-subunit alcohol dehydrogenase family)
VIASRRSTAVSSAVEELRKTGGGVTGIAADVGTAEGRTQTLQHTLDALGGLDILVNNAGGVRTGRLKATTEAEIEAMLTVDLLTSILLTRAAPRITECRRSSRHLLRSRGASDGFRVWRDLPLPRGKDGQVPARRPARSEGGDEWLFWQMGGLGPHGRPFWAADIYTIADMAAYFWIVPWRRQQQNLDDFVNLRRWYDDIESRPGTRRAHAKGEPFSTQPAVTEEGKKLLFGQTAASVAGTWPI